MKLLYPLIILLLSCSTEPEVKPEVVDPEDCAGVAGGTAILDDCGLCTGGTTESVANYLKDCAGECGGDATEDCTGECGGSSVLDFCGICDGDVTNDCVQDDCGIWGGNYEVENNTFWIAPSINNIYSLNYKPGLVNNLYGIQFDLSISPLGIFQDAESNLDDFTFEYSQNDDGTLRCLMFSMTGLSLNEINNYSIINLNLIQTPDSIIINEIIIAGESGQNVEANIFTCP